MITTVNGYYKNGVCVPIETLELEENQRVIITVVEGDEPRAQSKEEAIAELRSLCHQGKHVWTEDPSDYIRRMRDEDRF